MKAKIIVAMCMAAVTLFVFGCSQKSAAEEEYYRRSIEADQKAAEINKKAADDAKNMDFTVTPVKK